MTTNYSKTNCPERQYLSAIIIDGEGSTKEQEDARSHLTVCTDCSRYIDEMQTTLEMMHRQDTIVSVALPATFSSQVLHQITAPVSIWEDILQLSKRAVAVFVILVVFLFGTMLFLDSDHLSAAPFDEILLMNSMDREAIAGEEITKDDALTYALSR